MSTKENTLPKLTITIPKIVIKLPKIVIKKPEPETEKKPELPKIKKKGVPRKRSMRRLV